MFQKMYEDIVRAQTIYIYRHVSSDYDALGSQYGLAQLILDNFKDKKVVCLGEENHSLNRRMGINYQPEAFQVEKKSLALILDTSNSERIDGIGYDQCTFSIKVDHHIVVEQYANLNIEDPQASSTCELICQFYLDNRNKLNLSKEAATYLYYGLIGDTNRFMYESCSAKTLQAGALLLETGINKEAIYERMYLNDLVSLKITKYILNHFVFDEGVGYYVMEQEDLDDLNVSRDDVSMYVNTLANIKEIEVWAAITYEKEKDWYRVSLRSRHVPVEPVAKQFHGGGHLYASGAKLTDISQLTDLISALKEAIQNEISI